MGNFSKNLNLGKHFLPPPVRKKGHVKGNLYGMKSLKKIILDWIETEHPHIEMNSYKKIKTWEVGKVYIFW